jgi:hypothetical protein
LFTDLKDARPSLPLPPGVVELHQGAQLVDVSPVVERLTEFFYTVQHARVHDAEHGAAILPLREDLLTRLEVRGKSVLRGMAGLAPLIKELLERHGFRVRLTGSPPAPLPEPVVDALSRFQRVDWALIHFLCRAERGVILIERRGKVSVARLLAQIALAWPQTPIVIVVTRIEEARRLAHELRKFVPEVGLITSRDDKKQPLRNVLVVTPGNLRRGDVEVEKRGICIAVNPAELFAETLAGGASVAYNLWRARLYGILDTETELPPRLRDLVTALFGTHEVLIPRHGYLPLQREMVFSPIRGGNRPPNHKDEALIKRLGVHEHHLRNRRIVNLATNLALDARSLLHADYPEVAACIGERVGRVGVLVDHVPHGLALARNLQWPFVAGPHFCEEGLDQEDRDWIELGRDEFLRRRQPVVVTGNGMKRAGTFDVLIRRRWGRPARHPACEVFGA